MVSILKATANDAHLLAELSVTTFRQSHGHSAAAADIENHIAEKYSEEALRKELQDENNIFYFLYYNNKPAGFSKIILDFPCPGSDLANLTKLERIYILKEFHVLHLGQPLFDFIIHLIKGNNQAGIWLYVWTENPRAIRFYQKNSFVIIGSHDYKISETHSNPNHIMLLRF